VAEGLVARGAVLIDADAVVRELQQPGGAMLEAMIGEFGDGILDEHGALDRAAVAAVVFNDADALARLNKLTGRIVRDEIIRRTEALRHTDHSVVLDIPLLAEGRAPDGSTRYPTQAVLVVDCPVDVAVRRLVEHRGFDEDDARARISRQATREERLDMADFVVDNSGPAERLAVQVERAWSWMQQLA
jgi:dephospho-CoA kinase